MGIPYIKLKKRNVGNKLPEFEISSFLFPKVNNFQIKELSFKIMLHTLFVKELNLTIILTKF
jgi:hypothetical protein